MGQRIERYKILFLYKTINGLVQNCGVNWTYNQNSGTIFTEIDTKQYFITQRVNLFHYSAPRLFNKLPRNLRDDRNSTLDEWKMKLDKILSKIPDTPIVTDLTPGLCDHFKSKPTNYIFYWMPHLELNARR